MKKEKKKLKSVHRRRDFMHQRPFPPFLTAVSKNSKIEQT